VQVNFRLINSSPLRQGFEAARGTTKKPEAPPVPSLPEPHRARRSPSISRSQIDTNSNCSRCLLISSRNHHGLFFRFIGQPGTGKSRLQLGPAPSALPYAQAATPFRFVNTALVRDVILKALACVISTVLRGGVLLMLLQSKEIGALGKQNKREP